MASKRRSLRERDEHAIAGPPAVLAGQTAIDLPGAPEVEAAEVLSGAQPAPADLTASTDAPASQRDHGGAGEGTRRLGIYFHSPDFTAAKAAYLADWQAGGSADTFAKWIAAVLTEHAQLSPAQRAEIAVPTREGSTGSTRSFALARSVHTAVHAAVVADQEAGRWVSASTWAGIAIHSAAETTKRRAGDEFPSPPARLPSRLKR